MSAESYILVGQSKEPGPRGVALIFNGAAIIVGVRVARETAQMLISMAQLLEDTGGASPEVEGAYVPATSEFIEAQGFKTVVKP